MGQFLTRAAGSTKFPADTLSVQEEGSETETAALSHSSTHTDPINQSITHSRACILYVHRGKQVADTHTNTHSGRVKGGHLTCSSTLWATIVAASSCSASLRGRILKATCGTNTGILVVHEFNQHRDTEFTKMTCQQMNQTLRAHFSTPTFKIHLVLFAKNA